MKSIKQQYGFPFFVKPRSTNYLLKSEKTRVSDFWALWHYLIKTEKKKFPGTTDYPFLVSVLEQAQYFFDTATSAPIKSKPLLFYYSFLNLAKATIVLDNSTWLHNNKEFNHGIDSCPISSQTQLKDCFVSIKNLIPPEGHPQQKISVAYELAQILGDNIKHTLHQTTSSHDNGPWKINVISLLKSCVGIHRTVCETFKIQESFVHIEEPDLKKEGETLFYGGIINTTFQMRNLLSIAGYHIDSQKALYTMLESQNFSSGNLSRMQFLSFSDYLKSKGIWTYSTGNDFKIYINPNRLVKDPNNNIYNLHPFNCSTTVNQPIILSSAMIIYYLMFFLGSITRYHPYLFEKVLSDKEIWMVSEFLRTQPFQFLVLLTSHVLGKPIFSPCMPFV